MAFFIMKKNSLIFLIFISFIISFYNYDYDDWFYIIDPQNIKSITQDSFNIHFLAENGIFSYDLITEEFYTAEQNLIQTLVIGIFKATIWIVTK